MDHDPDSLCDTAESTTSAKRKRESEARLLSRRQRFHIKVEVVQCALIKVWAKGTETDPPPIGYVVKVEAKIWGEGDSVILDLDKSRRVFRGRVEGGVLTITKGEVDTARENSGLGFIHPDGVDLVTLVQDVEGNVHCVLI